MNDSPIKAFIEYGQEQSAMSRFFNAHIPTEQRNVLYERMTAKGYVDVFEHVQSRFNIGYFTPGTEHWENSKRMYLAIYDVVSSISDMYDPSSLIALRKHGVHGVLGLFNYAEIVSLALRKFDNDIACKACNELRETMSYFGYDFSVKEQAPQVIRSFAFKFGEMRKDMCCYVDAFNMVMDGRDVISTVDGVNG